MQRLYKINPTCPGCGEEHLYWQVGLTDEEQAILDTHTEEHKGESSIVSLMKLLLLPISAHPVYTL